MDNEIFDKKAWLASLKVGDEVAVRKINFVTTRYTFGKITKITPKGAMRLTSMESYLFKDGYANSGGKWSSTSYYIEPITEELKAKLLYEKKLNQIVEYKAWDKLGEPIINQIYEIMKLGDIK